MSEESQVSPAARRMPQTIDVLGVVPIVAVIAIGTASLTTNPGERPIDAIAFACGLVGALALMFWRHWSPLVVAVVAVTAAVYVARDYAGGPALLPGPLALVGAGYATRRRVAWLGALGYVTVVFVSRLVIRDLSAAHMLILVGWASASVLAGQAVAARTERLAAERERRAHREERAVATERLRIARDLHDSVAHAMATINVQAGVASHLLDRDAGQAKQALEAIRVASSDVLDELAAILSVLRTGSGAAAEGAPRSPVGTLGDLADLARRARSDGLAVTLGVDGDVHRIAPSVSAAGYRVVQEALTNARRHAGPAARADVAVDITDDGAVSIRVCDDGGREPVPVRVPADNGSGGFGLLGMRERVESTGGSLVAGHRPGGGFEVLAEWGPR